MQPMLLRPTCQQAACRGIDGFSINRDKHVRASQRDGLCAKRTHDIAHHIARDRTVLIDTDAQALQCVRPKGIAVAGNIRGQGACGVPSMRRLRTSCVTPTSSMH